MRYSVLILPNTQAMPIETLRRIEQYVEQGGVVIALERVPEASCGFNDYAAQDAAVRETVGRMFEPPVGRDGTGEHALGAGKTYWLKTVMDRSDVLERRRNTLDPFLKVLRHTIAPDMAIDFVRYDLRYNDGLAFIHRKMPDSDIYFVTNIQDRPVDMEVTFRVFDAAPSEWNPYTGGVRPGVEYEQTLEGTRVPLRLAAYASTFLVFDAGVAREHVVTSDFENIQGLDEGHVQVETSRNGLHTLLWEPANVLAAVIVEGVPGPLAVNAAWNLVLEGDAFRRKELSLMALSSWTELDGCAHFSGTGRYTAHFEVPAAYIEDDLSLHLSLGDVGNLAEVSINGHDAGVIWMRGQELDVTQLVRAGENGISIDVTNTLINRVAGLDSMPPVPDELHPRLGHGVHDRESPATALLGFEPLPRSGLLGPVEIRAARRVTIDVASP